MSSKGTIFLTEDNEHWYHDCKDNSITIEIDPKNIQNDDSNEYDGIIIEIREGCELWRIIMSARFTE